MSIEQIQNLINENKLIEAIGVAKTDAINALQVAALVCSKGHDADTIKLASYVCELQSDNPINFANLSFFCGNNMHLEDALCAIDKAIELDPNNADFYYNKAVIYSALERIEDAIATYKIGLEINPHNYLAQFNLGCMYCFLNDYKKGLPLLESRFLYDGGLAKFRKRFNAPQWCGENLNNKRILIFNEQGCGDVIQVLKYVNILKNKYNVFIIAEVQQELVTLVKSYFDITIGREHDFNTEIPEIFPDHDYVISFSSLQLYLDPNFEITGEPYVHVESNFTVSEKLNVGIAWAGSIGNGNDINRSCSIEFFKQLEHPNIQLYSLQKGRSAGVENLDCINLENQLTDFLQTTKIVKKLDLVIGVDTAIVHVAGALGIPVWLVLGKPFYHRWPLYDETTPWYNSMRLFRQDDRGDWQSVFNKVKYKLFELAFSHATRTRLE